MKYSLMATLFMVALYLIYGIYTLVVSPEFCNHTGMIFRDK